MYNEKQQIEITDSLLSAAIKLSAGNPGACVAIAKMVGMSPNVDPDSGFAEFTPLLTLDSHGIYGSRIWMLFKDVCKENATHALACLRALQLGLLNDSDLDHAIDNYGERVDTAAVLEAVQKRLPNFAKEGIYSDPS
jgi:hypothetical protein